MPESAKLTILIVENDEDTRAHLMPMFCHLVKCKSPRACRA